MARKRLTASQKLKIIRDADERTTNGESLKSVCRSYGIQPNQVRDWRRKVNALTQTRKSLKSSKNKCSSIFSYTPLFAIRVAWIYCIYDLHHLQIAVHEPVNQQYMADSIIFYRKCLFAAAVRKRKNGHDLGKTPLQTMIEWRKLGANPTNQTPIRPFSHPINSTDLGAATESYEKKRSIVRIEMKKKEPLIQHLPPSTRTDLNRTSISRYTFVPHMEWYSQVQPKFGLQMPTTATTTPTGAVSPIFWLRRNGKLKSPVWTFVEERNRERWNPKTTISPQIWPTVKKEGWWYYRYGGQTFKIRYYTGKHDCVLYNTTYVEMYQASYFIKSRCYIRTPGNFVHMIPMYENYR